MLTYVELIRARWVQLFYTLLITKSSHLNFQVIDNLPTRPTYEWLECVPSMGETGEVVKSMASGKAAGPDELPVELLKIPLDNDAVLSSFHDAIVDTWRGSRAPQEWNDSTIIVIHKKKDMTECGNYRNIPLVVHASKVLLNFISHHLSLPEWLP